MKIFAMADLHLSLASDKPMDVFGVRWNNHIQRMEDSWSRRVGEEDLFIISGDVSWGLKLPEALPDLEWIHRMPGKKKIVTRGNHDLWWTSLSKLNALYDDLVFVQNGCFAIGDTAICGTRGWMLPESSPEWTEHDEKIYRREQIRLELALQEAQKTGCRQRILSMHYPPLTPAETETGFTRLIEEYGVDIVLYGHVHGEEAGRHAFRGMHNGVEYHLVASDQLGFKPKYIGDVKEEENDG